MAVIAKLSDIVEAFELQGQQARSWFNRATGEVAVIQNEHLEAAEAGDEDEESRSQWEQEAIEEARRVVDSDDWILLPSSWDIHDWQIMCDFADSRENPRLRAELLDALHGRGAYGAFRNVIRRRSMWEPWNQFHASALRDIAIEWCAENGIAYDESAPGPATS